MTTLLDPIAWSLPRGHAGTPAPVCALTVLAAAGDREQLLLAVRDPQCNLTHPAVVSVPTQRLPHVVFEALVARVGGDPVQSALTGHDPVVYVVESVMARKLGLADWLERDGVSFEATVSMVVSGEACYPNLPDDLQQEPIDMVNLVVRLTQGRALFPQSTASYERLFWANLDDFCLACERRDPLILLPDAHPYELCLQGLCITAAASSIRSVIQRGDNEAR